VFLDSDLVDPSPAFAPALLGPLLLAPDVHLVKGFYRRPLSTEDSGGGRVTELMARPLLSTLRPELSGVVQPLSGEYAGTRALLEAVPFAAGYGVEIGLLLDAHATVGLAGIAQVNLGVRRHRNQPLAALGLMARQILGTALARCGLSAGEVGELTQFVQVAGEWLPDTARVAVTDRPPMRELLSVPYDTIVP
jgi:glucosyl-3-phosphoglycerate synthase